MTAAYIEIVPMAGGQEGRFKFTSSVDCHHLAMMLLNFEDQYVGYSDKISADDKAVLRASHGRESVAVQEEMEVFEPNVVDLIKLTSALERLKNKVLYPVLKETITKGEVQHLTRMTKDLLVISECIGALNVMKHQFKEVYLAIEMC